VLEDECREQHRGFLSLLERGRPFVSLKLATTLDGRIATATGESRWITGAEARAEVHRLRARSDAILVGSGTARADDPELTARRSGRVVHRPVRVLVDSRLQIPVSARLFRGEAGRTWVLCARGSTPSRVRAREREGALVLPVPKLSAGLDLRRGLSVLGKRGLSEVLVEGGGGIAAGLLRQDLVDEVHWFVAPRMLGSDALPALGSLDIRQLSRATTLEDVRVRRVGSDVYLRGRPVRRGKAGGAR
jgi:diaminohydroxyphosphoribosylaminopyrimidine deaminase/5-amino-6-(5-phosphoribosylamino)uracil reductase